MIPALPKAEIPSASPYENLRGPDDQSSEEYFKWTLNLWKAFIDKYDFINNAYNTGDLFLNKAYVQEPHGDQIIFKVMAKNKTIRNWFENKIIGKSKNQRGTKTESKVTLSDDDKKYWQECFFDKLNGHHTDPYLLTFSPFWKNGNLSNGGHRIILDSRMYMVEKQNIHQIDFDLKFSFLDLANNGKVKVVNLKGCKSRADIVQKIGVQNWEDKEENSFHPIDLIYFKPTNMSKESEKKINLAHSKRFIEYNDNLEKIDKIHAIESTVNTLIREESNWSGFQQRKLDPDLARLWGYERHKNHYMDARPYKWTLTTFRKFIEGLDVSDDIGSLRAFASDHIDPKVTKKGYTNYLSFRKRVIDTYRKCNKIEDKLFKITYPYLTQFFSLMMCLTRSGNQTQVANIIDEKQFIIDIVNTYRELIEESEINNNHHGTFAGVRSYSTSPEYLQRMLAMIITRLSTKDSVVLLDPQRTLSKNQSKLIGNISKITGQPLKSSDRETDHFYRDFSKGGVTNDKNMYPIEKELNRIKNDKGFSTSKLVEDMLSNPDEYNVTFTTEMREQWQNGLMDEQIKLESSDEFIYKIDKEPEPQLENKKKNGGHFDNIHKTYEWNDFVKRK